MATPEFWLLAGPNGAGKSTLAADPGLQSALAGVEIANPDAIALELLRKEGHAGFASAPPDTLRRCFLEAARETEEALFTALAEGRKVGAETVLSTAKYLRHVE